MRKVRWGILSTARIGVQKVIPAMQQCAHGEVAALASRRYESAQRVAAQLGIPQAYGSYEELLADPALDAVYNPTPNHLHVPLAITALQSGKHVLCEKPVALNAHEARVLLQAAREHPRLKIMEAFMYRFHPQWQKARELAQSGALGEVKAMHCFFSFYNDDPNNTRNQAALGGGALLDIGCYAASMPRFLFGAEPQRVCARRELDPKFKTDRMISGMIDFGDRTATFTCSTQLTRAQSASLHGTTGRLEIEFPLNPPFEHASRIVLHDDRGAHEFAFAPCNQFTLQGEAFNLAILNDTPVPTPLEDAVANMKVLDALAQSAEEKRWVEVI